MSETFKCISLRRFKV